ncbi:MAG TPA: HNH endonuclease [Methanospirillum sp.]|uniref:HNH endonuclease n=1 Tax=Methanospirillum sp. TaxID=45200 RepID=UPI002CA748D0|nr:HNH endonuclease [Methanospirillum sp.]HWQ65070.1 HNH endonuclease [Methanospirillum sp.]
MARLNWKKYQGQFDHFSAELLSEKSPGECAILPRIHNICQDDPAVDLLILGTEAPLIAFLEFLFARAEGPYTCVFPSYAHLIALVFNISSPLKTLLNLNASDAIGNMILNKRGRLKFAIADQLELSLLLEWWPAFGLTPVTARQVFEAVLLKSDISHRIRTEEPDLLLRLLEVFPEYQSEFFPVEKSPNDLLTSRQNFSSLPSQRRYHRLYANLLEQGHDLQQMIKEEEKRILPMQMRRNTFLSFLVKQLHNGECQICALTDGLRDFACKSPITVHHIIPLSEGGLDTARNMLVVCMDHHQSIHAGQIKVLLGDQIEVRHPGGKYLITPNP